jgi:tol-pal system protein YbgF
VTRHLRLVAPWVALIALGACASKGDLRRVEEQLILQRTESARTDSARAAQLGELIQVQRRIMDSLTVVNRNVGVLGVQVSGFKGDVANDLVSIQQQLVQIQALTGQSQQRLTELQTRVEARTEQLNVPVPTTPDSTSSAAAPPSPSGAPAGPTAGSASAEQVYAASLQQLRRGSPGTARMGFRELLRSFPTSPRVPDATYFLGETYAAESPDSATVYYGKVVEAFPQSARAASSLYKLGLLAERRKDVDGARGYFNRVLKDYPRSDEAALARDRLKTLGR